MKHIGTKQEKELLISEDRGHIRRHHYHFDKQHIAKINTYITDIYIRLTLFQSLFVTRNSVN